jgi:hypothetical protein
VFFDCFILNSQGTQDEPSSSKPANIKSSDNNIHW